MRFINLTPHDITVENLGTFPATGEIARVEVKKELAAEIAGVKAFRQVTGLPVGVPDSVKGVVYIVSCMVLAALNGRDDVVAPDTGETAIRNEKGHIIAVRNFIICDKK